MVNGAGMVFEPGDIYDLETESPSDGGVSVQKLYLHKTPNIKCGVKEKNGYNKLSLGYQK